MTSQSFHVLVAVAAFAALAPASASSQAAGRLTAVAGPAASGVTLALTPAEYNNTIADLLGLPRDGKRWPERSAMADKLSPFRAASTGVFLPPPPPPVWPWRFPSEPGSDGFEGILQGQDPSSYQVEELHLAAMHFAPFVLESPIFFTCDEWPVLSVNMQEVCAWESLERFAKRAYRRPLQLAELDRLRAFWQVNLAAGQLDEAIALTSAGILQAPSVHFRLESSDPSVPVSQWELATRLSYFLWDSMPDEELFAAAESGQLSLVEDVEYQVRRMLDDPRARSAIVHFHHQWLGTDEVLLVAPARRAFGPLFGISSRLTDASDDDVEWPAIMGPVRHSFKLETELFIKETIFDNDGTFHALLTDNRGYMSNATAPIYGSGARRLTDRPVVSQPIEIVVASIGREQLLTLYPAEFPRTERAGVLTLPSVLALGAYAVQPGPILRGKRVLERLACMEMGTPIQGAEAALPPDTLTAVSTNRQRTAAATSSATCTGCHRQINPPGFAFEHYDAIGRWRAQDNGHPVDASGSVVLTGGEQLTFDDGIDLAHQLAASSRVRDCYVLQWTRYAVGKHLDELLPELEALQARFREDDSIKELLVAIASSDLFRRRFD